MNQSCWPGFSPQAFLSRVRWLRLAVFIPCLSLAPPGASEAAEKFAICVGSPAFALVPLAALEGHFSEQGLQVEIKRFPSGYQALRAMLEGGCALSTAATPPVSNAVLRCQEFRILAAISSSSSYERIVARGDLGIRKPADLRGRRVAVVENSSAHYFLDTYLAAHGIPADAVNRVYLPADKIAEALQQGKVEAAAHWGYHVQRMIQSLGGRARVLEAPGLAEIFYLLLARDEVVRQSPGILNGVLRALVKAEASLARHPAQARSRLEAFFGLAPEEMAFTWREHEFAVLLDQPLLIALESIARWQFGRLPPATPRLPDFLQRIDAKPLRAVKPAAVTLID